MAATLHRFRSKADKLNAEQRARLRQVLLSEPDLPASAVRQIIATIDRATAAEKGDTFVMISAEQFDQVHDWLLENSKLPVVAARIWTKLFRNLDGDTGEILQTRDELADAVGTTPRDVSRIMSELESINAISRKREKVAGMRGPGVARYFMSPRVGTHLPGKAREVAQREAPPLRLVE